MIELKNISEFHDHTNVKNLHLAGGAEKEHDYKTLLQVLKNC